VLSHQSPVTSGHRHRCGFAPRSGLSLRWTTREYGSPRYLVPPKSLGERGCHRTRTPSYPKVGRYLRYFTSLQVRNVCLPLHGCWPFLGRRRSSTVGIVEQQACRHIARSPGPTTHAQTHTTGCPEQVLRWLSTGDHDAVTADSHATCRGGGACVRRGWGVLGLRGRHPSTLVH
jgi:hypothetical protein